MKRIGGAMSLDPKTQCLRKQSVALHDMPMVNEGDIVYET
jgi:hypothetical protein